jgi:FecR-like protein
VCALVASAAAIAVWLRVGVGFESHARAAAAPALLTSESSPSAPVRELRDGAYEITAGSAEPLRLGDSQLTLAPASELRVSGNDTSGWFLALERGRVDCQVKPRRERPPFVVIAGETRIKVLGTRFSVAQEADGTEITVDEGRVSVEAHGHTTELVSGESWTATSPPAPRAAETPLATPEPARAKRATRAAAAAERRFEQATRLESARPAAALRIYRALRRKPGPLAHEALYAEARLQLELGHKKSARPLLQRYLRRYPDGTHASEARAALEQLRRR